MTCSPAAIAARGVSQRSTVQILSGVLVARAEGPLELAATDMELSLRVPVAAQVQEPGSMVLPGRLLLEIVQALPQPGGHDRADAGHRRGARSPAARASTRCTPRAPRTFPICPSPTGRRSASSGKRSSRPSPRLPSGVAGRVAAGADRRAGRVLRGRGDDGRHRQLPAGGEAVAAARDPMSRARRSCRPERSASSAGSPPAMPRSRSRIGENQILFGADGVLLSARRIDGQFPN